MTMLDFGFSNPHLAGALGMLVLGFTHALGPDHLAAIALLSSPNRSWRKAARTSVAFASGHASLLLVCALLSVVLNWVPSEGFAHAAEVVSGITLILLGGLTLHTVLQHGHRLSAQTMTGTAALGGLLATSGARTFLLAISATLAAHSIAAAFLFALSFGIGVIVAMVASGVFLGASRERWAADHRIERTATVVMALACTTLGLYWTISNSLYFLQ